MAGDATFDVVSDFDRQELVNALDQVRREVGTRFDFKGAKVELELGKAEITLRTDSEMRARAIRDLIESKAVRRGLSLKIFDWGVIEPAGGNTVRQVVGLRRGLPEDLAKKISKLVRDDFPKLRSQIQGDAVRVSGKSRDELQRLITRLRTEAEDYPVALQFQNYRS
jgi:cyclic-di-GMP-binding protein